MIPTPRPIQPEGLFDGLRWSAILLGALIDSLLTMLTVGALLVYMTPDVFSEDAAASSRAMEQAMASREFLFASAFAGALCTVYAAFWAARRAGAYHVRHGGWTAVASALLAFLSMLPSADAGPPAPLWYEALGLALMLPAGILGGWIASRRAKRPA